MHYRTDFFTSTTQEAKASLRAEMLKAWKAHFDKAKAKKTTQNPHSYFNRFSFADHRKIQAQGPRKSTSAYFALKLGYGYLKCYLHRLSLAEHNRCRCGQKETPEHLLLSCRIYRQHRPASLRTGTQGDLFASKENCKDILDFISKTGIATREWHLARGEEEEDEYTGA